MLQLRLEFRLLIGDARDDDGGGDGGDGGDDDDDAGDAGGGGVRADLARRGSGFAVSYGSLLPAEHMGDAGGGSSGLRVQFITRPVQALRVYHDGELIATAPCSGLRSGRPTDVLISADAANGVSVHYGGQPLVQRVRWRHWGWAPQPDWQLAFSASVAARPDNHWVDDLRIQTGTHVADTPVPLSISLNGQQFMDVFDALSYVYEER